MHGGVVVHVVIPDRPHGQGRGRASMSSRGHLFVRTPAESRAYRELAQFYMRRAYRGEPLTVPLEVEIETYAPRPQSRPKYVPPARWRTGEPAPRIGKPDNDNVEKALFDAGNGLLWRDDAQICINTTSKLFAAVGGEAGVLLRVYEVPL